MLVLHRRTRATKLNKRANEGEFNPELGKKSFRNAKYDTSNFVMLRELITPDFMKTFEIPFKQRKLINPNKSSHHGMADMARNAFCDMVRIIIREAINNGYTFQLPDVDEQYIGVYSKSSIQMDRILDERCKVYKGVDLIKTDFKIYQFFFISNVARIIRQIRVNHDNYKQIENNANNGKIYKFLVVKKSKDYIEELYPLFPNFTEKQINKILMEGFSNLGKYMLQGNNIFIKNARSSTYMVIYSNNQLEDKREVLI